MPDYQALAYLALNDQVLQFRTKMTAAKTHLQAIILIQQAITDVTRRKALRVNHGLMENDFKGVNQSMEEDIKLMNDEIEKRLAQNLNLVVTNTRYVELLAKKREKKVNSVRTDQKLKEAENHSRDNLKAKLLSHSTFTSPLQKVSDQRKLEKAQLNTGMTCTKITKSSLPTTTSTSSSSVSTTTSTTASSSTSVPTTTSTASSTTSLKTSTSSSFVTNSFQDKEERPTLPHAEKQLYHNIVQ